jgi:hypothetical protein
MNFGSIFKKLFGPGGGDKPDGWTSEQEKAYKAQRGVLASERDSAIAEAWHGAAQSGALAEGGMAGLARKWGEMPLPTRSEFAQASKVADGQGSAPQGVSPSTMQLIGPPQAGNINITAPTGTKMKNYVPAQMSMSVPAPTALARLGLVQPQASPFQVTLPTGTKPKNYRPASMTMTPPSPVGQQGLMQVLAMMRRPRSPFGTDGGMG